MKNRREFEFFLPDLSDKLELPLSGSMVSAGFPSTADDFTEETLNIGQYMVRHPEATFYLKVNGDSMIEEGIFEGDILVVDKSERPYDGSIAVCLLNGEFTVKRLRIETEKISLVPANPRYEVIVITPDDDFEVWGIVRHAVKTFK